MSSSDAQIAILRKIYEFTGNFSDLRDFVDVTSDLFLKKQRDDVVSSPEGYAQFLSGEEEKYPGEVRLPEDYKRSVVSKFPDKFELVEAEGAGGEKILRLQSKAGQSFDVSKAAKEIEQAIKRYRSLRNSSLISLVSLCEWFAAQLLHYFLDKHPAAAGLGDRPIAYNELSTFESMDDAKRWVVAGKIEEILRGSFSDWIKFFNEKLKVDSSCLTEHFDFCQEACLRRNLLVHNGGSVNKIYIKKAPKKLISEIKEGDLIGITHDYFEDRLDRFEIVFVILALELWMKLDKRDELRCNAAVQISYYALIQQRWNVARAIAKYVCAQKNISESTILMAQVNYWQSYKWAEEISLVQGEISSWDVSAKGLSFQMAKNILLNENELAVDKLKKLIATKDVTAEDLKDWPLFRSLRESGELDDLLRQAELSVQ